jgi:hypothetical protein
MLDLSRITSSFPTHLILLSTFKKVVLTTIARENAAEENAQKIL